MTAWESLISKLEGLGLYDISQGSEIYARLSSLAAGLQIYYNVLDRIYREMFISTACEEGIEEYVELLSVYNADSSLEGKRKSIISALSVNEQNGADMMLEHPGDIYNVTGVLTDENGTVSFTVQDNIDSKSKALIEEHMRSLVPVGTGFELH